MFRFWCTRVSTDHRLYFSEQELFADRQRHPWGFGRRLPHLPGQPGTSDASSEAHWEWPNQQTERTGSDRPRRTISNQGWGPRRVRHNSATEWQRRIAQGIQGEEVTSIRVRQITSILVHQITSILVHQITSILVHQITSICVRQIISILVHQIISILVHQIISILVHQITAILVHQITSILVHQITSILVHQIISILLFVQFALQLFLL